MTLNTLVFDHELFEHPDVASRSSAGAAIEALRVVADAAVDALIVQDVGLALLCQEAWHLLKGEVLGFCGPSDVDVKSLRDVLETW